MEITKRLVEKYPGGALFQNTSRKQWPPESVNCAFQVVRYRMCNDEMKLRGMEISPQEIAEKIKRLSQTMTSRGKVVPMTTTYLRVEAKRKLIAKLALELIPQYSLYALRHSWATQALLRGVDPLTVAILMGHEDPSMLPKVYQHLSLNPKHMLAEAEWATRVG